MKKFGILAVAAITALVLGSVASFGNQNAQAEVDGSAAVWCGFFGALETPLNACDGLTDAEIITAANQLGDEDALLEAGELDDIDLDANQLTDGGAVPLNEIILFAFVDNDGAVTFDADTGLSIAVQVDGADQGTGTDGNLETCDDEVGSDLDCDTSILDDGNGVVTAVASDGTADAGEDVDVDIFQADDTNQVSTETLAVVGAADELSIIAYEQAIETSGSASDVTDCLNDSDATDADQLGDVNRTFVAATVVDNDEVELTRIAVDISTDDEDIADIDVAGGGTTAVTVDAGDIGTAFFAVVCGGEDTGTATVTAEINAGEEDADVTIEVVGAPAAIALTAAPAGIICNGNNAATVTATVTDSDGNLAAGGTNVNFSVVALGTANPINFGTVEGVASSQITPLAGTIAGVTVVVSAGDAEASILIECNTPEVIATAVATFTPGTGVVTPPDTGSGGYADQDSSGMPAWMLIALALGAMALIGGGVFARRASK